MFSAFGHFFIVIICPNSVGAVMLPAVLGDEDDSYGSYLRWKIGRKGVDFDGHHSQWEEGDVRGEGDQAPSNATVQLPVIFCPSPETQEEIQMKDFSGQAAAIASDERTGNPKVPILDIPHMESVRLRTGSLRTKRSKILDEYSTLSSNDVTPRLRLRRESTMALQAKFPPPENDGIRKRVGTMSERWLLSRLVLIMLLPLAGLIAISTITLISNVDRLNSANSVKQNVLHYSPMDLFLHESQKERGRTGVFTESNGTLFKEILVNQRTLLDAARERLEVEINRSADLRERSVNLTSLMAQIEEHRSAVDQFSLPQGEAVDFYTRMNTELIQIMSNIASETSHPALSDRLVAYIFFVKNKEAAGLERGIGGETLARGSFSSRDRFLKFASLVAEQALLYGDLFTVFSPASQVIMVNDLVRETNVTQFTNQFRATLLSNDPVQIGAAPATIPILWFENMTILINALYAGEIEMLVELTDAASGVRNSAIVLLVVVAILLAVTVISTMFLLFWITHTLHSRSMMEEALARFLPTEFLNLLGIKNITEISLGTSKHLNLAIVFLDVRDFTNLSEAMSMDEVYTWLISLTAVLSPIVRHNGGWIDKFSGDGILAIFESPTAALVASIQMVTAVRALNDVPEVLNGSVSAFDVGIGAHWGPVILGTVGDAHRQDGTIISDAVNLASRLEGLTKTYGVHILCSGDLLDNADPEVVSTYKIQRLGRAIVKGRSGAINIHDVYESDDPLVFAFKADHQDAHNDALELFMNGDFKKSARIYANIIARYKEMCSACEEMRGVSAYGGGRPYMFRYRQCLEFIAGRDIVSLGTDIFLEK